MLLVTIILIILLSLALIKVIAKGKFFDCKIKTVEQFHDAIWNNAHEFIFFDRPDFSCSRKQIIVLCISNLSIKTELVLVRFYNADMPESRKIVISMNGVGAVLSGIK